MWHWQKFNQSLCPLKQQTNKYNTWFLMTSSIQSNIFEVTWKAIIALTNCLHKEIHWLLNNENMIYILGIDRVRPTLNHVTWISFSFLWLSFILFAFCFLLIVTPFALHLPIVPLLSCNLNIKHKRKFYLWPH